VELSRAYIKRPKLPDKAIDVIDEGGAMQIVVGPQAKEGGSRPRRSRPVIATNGAIPPNRYRRRQENTLAPLEYR